MTGSVTGGGQVSPPPVEPGGSARDVARRLSVSGRLSRRELEFLPLSGPGSVFSEVQGRQPGASTTPEDLVELISSIAAVGVLQPILVERLPDDSLRLVAGERRLRAAKWGAANLPGNPHFTRSRPLCAPGRCRRRTGGPGRLLRILSARTWRPVSSPRRWSSSAARCSPRSFSPPASRCPARSSTSRTRCSGSGSSSGSASRRTYTRSAPLGGGARPARHPDGPGHRPPALPGLRLLAARGLQRDGRGGHQPGHPPRVPPHGPRVWWRRPGAVGGGQGPWSPGAPRRGAAPAPRAAHST